MRPSDSPMLLKPRGGAAGAGSMALHRPCVSEWHPSSTENRIKETLGKQEASEEGK